MKSINRKETLTVTMMNQSFDAAINAVANHELSSHADVTVREHTPSILTALGLEDLPMKMTVNHLKAAISSFSDGGHKHGLDADTMSKIPFALLDPVFIFDSQANDESVVVVTDLYDQFGQPIIVAIKCHGYDKDGNPSNFVTSIYGKRKKGVISLFNHAVEDFDGSAILYCNRAKWAKMQTVLALQATQSLDAEFQNSKEYGDKGFLYFSLNAENALEAAGVTEDEESE